MSDSLPSGSDSPLETNGAAGRTAPRVVIVGASARAAAFSAIRAGLQPVCLDQFADLDLQRVADASLVERYPQGIVDYLGPLEGLPVLYTGAMENHPEILQTIAGQQPLLGNNAETLAVVRDPFRVYEVLTDVRVPCLDVRRCDNPPPADGTWLLKPLSGAAGRGVRVWDDTAASSPTLDEPHYFQQRGPGPAISAVYVAFQDPFQLQYVGLTRQLIGVPELNAPPFAWCGSIGPVALDTRGEILARRIGTVLAHRFGLRGLFGCDFVLNDDGEPLLTEVNPRYTGSVEILELLCGSTLVAEHCRATGYKLPEGVDSQPVAVPTSVVVGKVILYSDRDLVAPDTSAWGHISPWQPLPGFADVPQPGSVIRQGSPICSILAMADTLDECEEQLLASAAGLRTLLAECQTP